MPVHPEESKEYGLQHSCCGSIRFAYPVLCLPKHHQERVLVLKLENE